MVKQDIIQRAGAVRVLSLIICLQILFFSSLVMAAEDPTQPTNPWLIPANGASVGIVATKVDTMNSLWTVISNSPSTTPIGGTPTIILSRTWNGTTVQMILATGASSTSRPVNVTVRGGVASISQSNVPAVSGLIQNNTNTVSVTRTSVPSGSQAPSRVTYDISFKKADENLAVEKLTITSQLSDKPAWSKEEYRYDEKQRLTDSVAWKSNKHATMPMDVNELEEKSYFDYEGDSHNPVTIFTHKISTIFDDFQNRSGNRLDIFEETREHRRYMDGTSRFVSQLIVKSSRVVRSFSELPGTLLSESFHIFYQLVDGANRSKSSGEIYLSGDNISQESRAWVDSLNSVDKISSVQESSWLSTQTLSFYGSSELRDEQLRHRVQYVRGDGGMIPQSIEYGPRMGGDPSAIYLVDASQTSEAGLSDPTLHRPIRKSSFVDIGGEKHAYRFYQQYNESTDKSENVLEIEVGYDPIQKRKATVKIDYPTIRRVVIQQKTYDIFSDVKGEIILVPLGAAA